MFPVVTGKGGQKTEAAVANIPGIDTTAEETSGACASGITIALQAENRSSRTVRGELNSCPFIKCLCWRTQARMVMSSWELFSVPGL